MACSGLPAFIRSLHAIRLTPRSAAHWVRQQSSQGKDELVAKYELVPSEASILTPLDAQNNPDLHINQLGEVYDRERIARDVSRMYPQHRLRMAHVNKMPEPMFDFQNSRRYLRKMYARFGRSSGIDPGVMWPSREEIEMRLAAERDLGIPTLQESWVRVYEKRKTELELEKAQYEKVDANMAKMADDIKAFRKRQRQAEEVVQAEKRKREKLMEEAKEVLGFHVDPKDKRFQELMVAKETEAKKQEKAARKKEKEAKVIARLTTVDGPAPS